MSDLSEYKYREYQTADECLREQKNTAVTDKSNVYVSVTCSKCGRKFETPDTEAFLPASRNICSFCLNPTEE